MRVMELARWNFKEIWLDPMLLGVTILLPPALLLVLQALGRRWETRRPSFRRRFWRRGSRSSAS